MKLLVFFTLLLCGTLCFASSNSGHTPSIKDLIAPAFNFIVLFGSLIYFLRKPLREMFIKKSRKVAKHIEDSEVKSRKAQIMLDMFKDKLKNIESKKDSIKTDLNEKVLNFDSDFKAKTDLRIKRTEVETINRIEDEKLEGLSKIKEDLLSEIIENTKEKIKTDSKINKKIKDKILKDIRL